MDVTTHLKRLPRDEAGTPVYVPHLPCSKWGLPSSISHLMDWCAFTAPFHLYNAFRRCSLLSVALSIASPLLGVTQHPALRSPDFPHPDCGTRSSTQLKPFYYTRSGSIKAMKLDSCWLIVQLTVNRGRIGMRRSLLQEDCQKPSVLQKKRRGWKPRLQCVEIRN